MVCKMISSLHGCFFKEFQSVKTHAQEAITWFGSAKDETVEKIYAMQKQLFAGLQNVKTHAQTAACWLKDHPSKALDVALTALMILAGVLLIASFTAICVIISSVFSAALLGISIGTSLWINSSIFVFFLSSVAAGWYYEFNKEPVST